MTNLSRRAFLPMLFAAPAIVRASSLMPVRSFSGYGEVRALRSTIPHFITTHVDPAVYELMFDVDQMHTEMAKALQVPKDMLLGTRLHLGRNLQKFVDQASADVRRAFMEAAR